MSTSSNDDIDRLLWQNRQAARDVELDAPLQLEPEGLPGFVRTQVEINKSIVERLGAMQDDVAVLKDDVASIKNDMGQVKGGHARTEVIAKAETVAMELGFDYLRQVTARELHQWSKAASNGTDPDELQSFRRADLVIEVLDGGELVYLAVEISYTVDNRDAARASRNAELLQQITSHRAQAVVAGAIMRPSVQEQVDQGSIRWFPTKSGMLEPD